jgi:bacterioferritin-associated ferredoxin
MEPDDTVCFCFHVSCRKLRNHARHHKPPVASLMTECLGAGTGCGWCRKLIIKIWEQNRQGGKDAEQDLPSAADRLREREKYWLEKYGRAPKAGEAGK